MKVGKCKNMFSLKRNIKKEDEEHWEEGEEEEKKTKSLHDFDLFSLLKFRLKSEHHSRARAFSMPPFFRYV